MIPFWVKMVITYSLSSSRDFVDTRAVGKTEELDVFEVEKEALRFSYSKQVERTEGGCIQVGLRRKGFEKMIHSNWVGAGTLAISGDNAQESLQNREKC